MRLLIYVGMILFIFSCKNKEVPNQSDRVITTPEQNVAPQTTIEEISHEKAKELLASQPEIVLLDVRTPDETNQGIIESATIMDIYDPEFASKLDLLDKSKPYIVYCAVGGRSKSACEMMKEKGFQKVYNLSGGYRAWKP